MTAPRTPAEMREAAALLCDQAAGNEDEGCVHARANGHAHHEQMARSMAKAYRHAAREIRALPVADVPGIDLAAIGARERAATPGPWEPNGDDWRATGEPALVCAGRSVVAVIQFEGTDADAAFIAHAREDVPALIAEVRRLRAQMAEARGVLTPLAVQYDGCDLGSTIALALAALSPEAPLPDTAATGGAVDSDRGGEPTPEVDAYAARGAALVAGVAAGREATLAALERWALDPSSNTGMSAVRGWIAAQRNAERARRGVPTQEEMARLDAGQTTTMRALCAGALTEARAEKAEAENKRLRAELAEYRDADRERKDIL